MKTMIERQELVGKVIEKSPNSNFLIADIDFNKVKSLDYLQQTVEGLVDVVSLNHNIDIWVNDEGLLQGLEPTIALVRNQEVLSLLVGNIVVASTNDEGETLPLTDEQVELFKKMISKDAVSVDGKIIPCIEI